MTPACTRSITVLLHRAFTVSGINLGSTLGLNLLDDLSNPDHLAMRKAPAPHHDDPGLGQGMALASVFDLYIYKFNDATQTFEQMRVQPKAGCARRCWEGPRVR